MLVLALVPVVVLTTVLGPGPQAEKRPPDPPEPMTGNIYPLEHRWSRGQFWALGTGERLLALRFESIRGDVRLEAESRSEAGGWSGDRRSGVDFLSTEELRSDRCGRC
jgi:hypothetical protein